MSKVDIVQTATILVPPTKSAFIGGQPLDLVGLQDLKSELGIQPPSVADDRYLLRLITRASATAQKYCNRLFIAALCREAVFPRDNGWPGIVPPNLDALTFSQWPVIDTPSPAGTPPPRAPILSTVASGMLPAARYFVRLSYATPQGESALSLESVVACPNGMLPQIVAAGPDALGLATGVNVYVSKTSFAETLQTTSPIGVNAAWTLPGSGLIAGAAPPPYMTVVEGNAAGRPLAEGVDFFVDPDNGVATRIGARGGRPRAWGCPITAIYDGGFTAATMPDDLQEAILLLAKMRFYARGRDPLVRSESVPGVLETTFWGGAGIGGQGDLPAEVTEKLDRYRVPVTG